MADKKLSILIAAYDQASGVIGRVSGSLNRLGVNSRLGHTALATLGMRMRQAATGVAVLAGTGGLLGLGGVLSGSITKARDFAASMELLRTQTGATQAEVDAMSQAVLGLSGQVATGPEALAAGLYHIESAGLRGAKALEILKVAAEGARVGNADLESVTNALIAANQSGVKGVQDMASAMGTLNAIVGSGNMRMQDLTDAFTTGVLSSAKNFGVSIQSVGAALADMTDQGIPAIDAATRLNSAMRLMAAPTPKAAKLLKGIGLEATTLANDMRGPGGILAAIEDLRSHLDKSGLSLSQQAALLANAFGGKQSGGILTLVGKIDLLKKKVDAVGKGAKDFSGAWEATTHTAAFKFENFGAIVDAQMTKIGAKLLPMVADALGSLGNWFDKHGDDIANFFAAGAKTAQDVAGVIGKVVGAFNMLPGWLKELLIGGAAVNVSTKFLLGFSPLSLGKNIIGGLAGQLGKSLFQRGGTPATPLFVADVTGGLGGGVPGVGGGGGGLLAKLLMGGAAVAGGAFAGFNIGQWLNENYVGAGTGTVAPAKTFEAAGFTKTMAAGDPAAIQRAIKSIEDNLNPSDFGAKIALALDVNGVRSILEQQLAQLKAQLPKAVQEQNRLYLAQERLGQEARSQAARGQAAMAHLGVYSLAGTNEARRTNTRLSVLEGIDRGILAKKTAVNVHNTTSVAITNNISINEWQRKAVSVARSNANYGGFI